MEEKIDKLIETIDNYGKLLGKFDLESSYKSAENQAYINKLDSQLKSKSSEIDGFMRELSVEELCRLQQRLSVEINLISSEIYGTVSTYGSELLGKDLIFGMDGKIRSFSSFMSFASSIIQSKSKTQGISEDFAKPLNVNSDETYDFLKSSDVSSAPVNEYNYIDEESMNHFHK